MNRFALTPIRQILYDILTAGENENGGGDVNMVQKMGLEMSNAIRKEGVTVVQLQSYVNQKVINKVAQALQTIDAIEGEVIGGEQMLLDEPLSLAGHIKQSLAAGQPMNLFIEDLARRYAKAAVEKYGIEAACSRLRIKSKRVNELTME